MLPGSICFEKFTGFGVMHAIVFFQWSWLLWILYLLFGVLQGFVHAFWGADINVVRVMYSVLSNGPAAIL